METILHRRIVVIGGDHVESQYPVVSSFNEELTKSFTHFVEINDPRVTRFDGMIPEKLSMFFGPDGLWSIHSGPIEDYAPYGQWKKIPRAVWFDDGRVHDEVDDGLEMFNRTMREHLDAGDYETVVQRCPSVICSSWRLLTNGSYLTSEILTEALNELSLRKKKVVSSLIKEGQEATRDCRYVEAIELFDRAEQLFHESSLTVDQLGTYWSNRSMAEWRLGRRPAALHSILQIVDGTLWTSESPTKLHALKDLHWYIDNVDDSKDLPHEKIDETIQYKNVQYRLTRRYETGILLAVYTVDEKVSYLRFASLTGCLRMGVPYLSSTDGRPLSEVHHSV